MLGSCDTDLRIGNIDRHVPRMTDFWERQILPVHPPTNEYFITHNVALHRPSPQQKSIAVQELYYLDPDRTVTHNT